MPHLDATPPLLRPLPGGGYELSHPLGLRALASLPGRPSAAEVRAEVTVGHLLECQDDVERDFLARPSGPKLVLTLRGPLGFASDELARLAPEVKPAQLDAAVALLRAWSARAPERIEARLDATFVGLTPWTSLVDLRGHLEGLHRHDLPLDPLAPLVAGPQGGRLAERARREGLWLAAGDTGGGPGFRVLDEDVQAVVASIPGGPARERQARLKEALDAVAGVPRGEKRKHLRLLPAPRYDERRPSRTGHVDLTRACDLACGFCTARGPEARAPRQRAAQAIAGVRRVASEGATTLVLGGAEPTQEWYLEDLVTLARGLRFEHILLETNAVALAEPGRAEALARAGLTDARVALNSFDEARADAISGVPGALARTLAGVRALLDAGVAVELATALLPENRGDLARIVAEATARLPPSRARVERVVARPILAGPPRSAPLLPVAAAARELLEGARAAAAGGLALEVAPGAELPPCVFEDVEAAASVLRLGEGLVSTSREHARVPLCEACGAREVCPGPRRGLEAAVTAIGRSVPPGARGVPPTGERERVLRELRSVLFKTGPDGKVHESRVLRVNFHCNQACDFCFVSRELPAPEDALLQAELEEVARRGASLAISGGEPTLNPRLPEYLRRTVELGITEVQLQTNAVKMSDPAYANALAAAGLRTAFVSLHGTTAATCDRVTAAPGTFVRTVAGIQNLLRAGVTVCCNFVLCAYNAAELADLPDFVARELRSIPGARVEINFSFVAAGSENVPRDTSLIPRFSDVAWSLETALTRARALGLTLLGFDSQCGVPACLLPQEVRDAWFVEDLPAEEITAFAPSFRKAETCASCSLTRRCYGLRTSYAEMYGTGELRPVGGG